jgi:hypothetical protein
MTNWDGKECHELRKWANAVLDRWNFPNRSELSHKEQMFNEDRMRGATQLKPRQSMTQLLNNWLKPKKTK